MCNQNACGVDFFFPRYSVPMKTNMNKILESHIAVLINLGPCVN